MLILSVDPGLAGHWILADMDSKILGSWKMPLDKNRKFCPIETWKLICEIDNISANDFEDITVCLEGLLSLPSDTNKITLLIKMVEKDPTPELFENLYKELKKTDGRISTKTMSINWGILRGQFVAKGWKCFTPSPRQWQADVYRGIPGANAKIRGYNFCRSKWPDEDLTEGKRQGFNNGKTDAMCLNEYLRRQLR